MSGGSSQSSVDGRLQGLVALGRRERGGGNAGDDTRTSNGVANYGTDDGGSPFGAGIVYNGVFFFVRVHRLRYGMACRATAELRTGHIFVCCKITFCTEVE